MVLCLQVLARDELNPQLRGKMHLFDSESEGLEYRRNIDRTIAQAYKEALAYLNGISEAFGEKYMSGEEYAEGAHDPLYNPERAVKLEHVHELTAIARGLVNKNRKTPERIQALAWRLLERHTEYCDGLADVFIAKARGFDKLSLEMMDAFIKSFGRHDYELERWCDFGLLSRSTRTILVKMPHVVLEV